MVPLIERELVTKHGWIKESDLADVLAVVQSAPGAIAINSATFIGYRLAGVPGAVIAMFGTLLPTSLIVLILGIFYLHFQDNPKVNAAFKGIGAAIVAIILYAGYKLGKVAVLDKTTFVVLAATVGVLLLSSIHPVIVILGGAVSSILFVNIKDRLGKNRNEGQQNHAQTPSDANDGLDM